jgi:hypothetical protein
MTKATGDTFFVAADEQIPPKIIAKSPAPIFSQCGRQDLLMVLFGNGNWLND